MTGDHFHISVGCGPAQNRRKHNRPAPGPEPFQQLQVHVDGLSGVGHLESGAPTLTKSFCMSTTISAELSWRSSNTISKLTSPASRRPLSHSPATWWTRGWRPSWATSPAARAGRRHHGRLLSPRTGHLPHNRSARSNSWKAALCSSGLDPDRYKGVGLEPVVRSSRSDPMSWPISAVKATRDGSGSVPGPFYLHTTPW